MKNNNLPEKFFKTLKDNNLTVVCAESITAGLLSSTIASISGASSILKGSIVTYSRELKSSILKVDPRIIDECTAESMETTVEMVYGLINLYPSSDIYVAVTGIASPGTLEYPIKGEVGDVFIAIYNRNKKKERLTEYKVKISETDRNVIREKAVSKILEFVLEDI
jgi:nicotinamide-nucleotide amidase